jgi:alginate biosynthesis protein AlgX
MNPVSLKIALQTFIAGLILFIGVFAPALARAQEITLCDDLIKHEKDTYLKDIRIGDDGWLFSSNDFPSQGAFDAELLSYFSRLQSSLAQRNIKLMLVLVPPRGMVAHASAPAEMLNKYKYDSAKMERNYTARLDQLKAIGIVVPNIYTALKEAEKSEAVFFKRDHHWTPKGAAAAAREIGEEIRQLPFYSSLAKTTVSLTDDGQIKNVGSVETYVEKICKTKIPDEEFTRTVSTQDSTSEQGLLDDYTPDVVVVGTSMSNRDSRDTLNFVGALKHYAKVDIVNYALAGGGRATSIVNFLQSDDFFQHPPKLLIWELPVSNLSADGKRMQPLFSQILAQVQGECSAQDSLAGVDLSLGPKLSLFEDVSQKISAVQQPYLHLRFSDLSLVNFEITFIDATGAEKMIPVNRRLRVANSGEFFMEFPEALESVSQIEFTTKQSVKGTVKAKICKAN